jgi:hypothetical protein
MSWGGGKPDVPKLDPNELFDKRRERDQARLKAYNKLLEQIYHKIRTSSKMGGNAWINYTIPPFIIGLPRLDLIDTVVYLVHTLRQQKYEVRYTYPNMLYISWKHHERDYLTQNSPIMQALIPPEKPAPARKGGVTNSQADRAMGSRSGGRVRFEEPAPQGILKPSTAPDYSMFGLRGEGAGGGRAPPRDVHSYTPPSQFLNDLTQPTLAPRKSALDDLIGF